MMPNILLFKQIKKEIEQGKPVIISVKGESMRPFLKEDERVILRPFNGTELKRGVIVLAKRNNQVLLHRVVKIKNECIWLAGDANLVQHERVRFGDVLAIADSVFRNNVELKLNNRARNNLGMWWYWARPLRRIGRKLF